MTSRAAGLREAAEICRETFPEYVNGKLCHLPMHETPEECAIAILARATAAEKSAPTEVEALADEVEALTKEWRGDIADRVVIYREQALRIIAALRHKEPR